MNDEYVVLKKHHGLERSDSGQEEVIESIISGKDSIIIMDASLRKKLCSQVSALMYKGVIIIISQSVMRIKEQVQSLSDVDINAAYPSGALTNGQFCKTMALARDGSCKIICTEPKNLIMDEFMKLVSGSIIDLVVVEEAQRVSEYSKDFCQDYLYIPTFLRKIRKHCAVCALMEPSPEWVKEDMIALFGLRDPYIRIPLLERRDIFFAVARPKSKLRFTIDYVLQHPDNWGIIYCATSKKAGMLCRILRENRISVSLCCSSQREEMGRWGENFISERMQVCVITNRQSRFIGRSNAKCVLDAGALGAGRLDAGALGARYVIHHNMCASIEDYMCEICAATSGASRAECILLYSPQDVNICQMERNLNRQGGTMGEKAAERLRVQDETKLQAMISYCLDKGCLKNHILEYFGAKTGKECESCSSCVPGRVFVDIDAETEELKEKMREVREKRRNCREKRIKPEEVLNERGMELFKELRSLRRHLSESDGLPPYIIFSDRSLIDMVMKCPVSLKDFQKVKGVGAIKLERYGACFLSEIASFTGGGHESFRREEAS